MSVFNSQARVSDRKQSVAGMVVCQLVDISSYYASGTVPPDWNQPGITLYTNPQEINRGLEATWSGARGLLSTSTPYQYMGSDRSDVQLTGVLVDTQCADYDATPWLDSLERMTLPGVNSHPPILAIVWGARVIQPVVLSQVNIRETAWANGLVSQATLELTFKYQGRSGYKSNADERRVASLTEREKAKVKQAAEASLKKGKGGNKRQLPGSSKVTNKVINKVSPQQRKPITVSDAGVILQGDHQIGTWSRGSDRLAVRPQINLM
jgi:hypothetical protein